MSALKTMLQYGGGAGGTVNVNTMTVYNTNVDSENNGGCCCLWTAPASTTWIAVEMWGGGGSGAGNCCCSGGWSGGSGTYTRKIVTVVAGQNYRFCAAGSTYCGNSYPNGCSGLPSYLYGETEAANLACAAGGLKGKSVCYFGSNCSYQGCSGLHCGSYCGTFGICGVGGIGHGSPNCWNGQWEYQPGAPFTGVGWRRTKDGCSGYCGGCCNAGFGSFPGGGGGGSMSHTTGGYCGTPGAGGLILVQWSVTS